MIVVAQDAGRWLHQVVVGSANFADRWSFQQQYFSQQLFVISVKNA
jgi:hypothetical protein